MYLLEQRGAEGRILTFWKINRLSISQLEGQRPDLAAAQQLKDDGDSRMARASSPTTRAKDDMITQTIKRWLNRLFAWWPWKRSLETSYAQAISNMNASVTQESMLRNTVDGPLPQTGSTSVAVEQGRDEDIPESSRPTTEERPEQLLSSHPLLAEETPNPLPATDKEKKTSTGEAPLPSPTPEQKLAFLQYLVKRGTINEGFSAEQIPKQYKKYQK